MSNVQVSIRLRPCSDSVAYVDNNSISIYGREYQFSSIYDTSSTQEDVFVNSVQQIVDKCFDGFNCTVMVYGQTGSGKTYTMGMGLDTVISGREYGIVFNTLEYIFNRGEHKISCNFIEIYNDEVYDLLNNKNNLVLREFGEEVIICGIKEINLNSLEEAKNVIKRACLERTTKDTKINQASSRSHAIFSLNLTKTLDNNFLVSKINFVDLAGSERIKKSGVIGEKVKEAININQGLLALGNVINSLYHKTSHIPYRSSKITRILRPSLGGTSQTLFIACINPSASDLSETQNTLKYAQRVTAISNNVTKNKEIDKNKLFQTEQINEIRRLKQENITLKQQIKEYHKYNNQIENKENKKLKQKITHLEKIIKEYETKKCNCNFKIEDNINNIKLKDLIIEDNKKLIIEDNKEIENNKKLIINNNKEIENNKKLIIESNKEIENNKEINNNKKLIIENNKEIENNINKNIKRKVTFNLEDKIKFIKKEDKIKFVNSNKRPVKNEIVENNTLCMKEKIKEENEHFKLNIKKILEEHRNSISEIIYNNGLYSCSLDGSIRKWDIEKNTCDILVEENNPIKNIIGGNDVYFSCKNKLINIRGEVINTYGSDISALFLEDRIIIGGHEDGSVSVFDIRKGLLNISNVHRGTVFRLLKFKDKIYSGSRDHSVGVIGEDISILKPPHYDSVHLLLGIDNNLISGSRDCSLKKWNINSGVVQKTVPYAHNSWIKCGYKLKDGFCSGAKDGSLVFWSVDKNINEKYKFYVDGSINSIAENNNTYFIGSQNKKIYIVR